MEKDFDSLYGNQVAVVLREPVALVTPTESTGSSSKDILELERVLGLTGILQQDSDAFIRLENVTCYYVMPDDSTHTRIEKMFNRECMYVPKKDISLLLKSIQ